MVGVVKYTNNQATYKGEQGRVECMALEPDRPGLA